MKKNLLIALILPLFGWGQNTFSFGFDGTISTMTSAGWAETNQSTSASSTVLWSLGSYTAHVVSTSNPSSAFLDTVYAAGTTCPVPNGQAGGGNSFALVNYTSTSSTATSGATISNWLITPSIIVENGDVVSFYTRKGTAGTTDYADRLELRMSSDGVNTLPSGGPAGVGSYTVLCASVNPALASGFVYPQTWTKYTYTVAGLSGATAVKFGFRYFVTNAGANGSNSDIIGIDTFSVDKAPLAVSDVALNEKRVSVYPNPVKDILNIKSTELVRSVKIVSMAGQIISEENVENNKINVSKLTKGAYNLIVNFGKITENIKFIKE